MLTAIDNTPVAQPLPSASYVNVCVAEDNPWRKLFYSGTAGTTTAYFCTERLNNGAPYQFVKLASKIREVPAPLQNDIETLIALMKPSMSQLAIAFGVSRQRIYDWRNGAGMSPTNVEQMSALLTAARTLSERSSVPLSQVTNRKLSGGMSFWDAISSGMLPTDAAVALLKIIDRDESERNALKRSLASRDITRAKEPPQFSSHLSE